MRAAPTEDCAPPPVLRLVSDPHRWRILGELARSDRRVGELSELLGSPQNLVSYHLAALRTAGLVRGRRSSADGRDSWYRADLIRLRDLLATSGATIHPGLRLLPAPAETVARRSGPRPLVLFLCTGNSARSQMAEALLEHRSARAIGARSAGSHPKPLHPNAVRVMAERGIDISGRTAKHVGRFARTRFDRVITLCDRVREICPEFTGRPLAAHWSMADPAGEGASDEESYPAFRRTADELDDRIGLLVLQMTTDTKGPKARAE